MNSELLAGLIDQHADALELYARQWCDSPEDVVQEAFVKLAAQSAMPQNPAAWLFRTVRNGAINSGIASRRRRRYEASVAKAPSWFETHPANRRHPDITPESAQSALETLPADQREVIVARLWGGLTFQQIAELTGTPASSVHRHYHAGLKTLRERLGVSCRPNTPLTIPS